MKKNIVVLAAISIFAIACNQAPKTPVQPQVLEEKCGFDMERIDFKENVYQLFSKVLEVDGSLYHPEKEGNLDLEKLDFVALESVTVGIRIPKEKYGYLFRSVSKDSIARFGNVYFNGVGMLTKRDTSLMAAYGTGSYIKKRADLDSVLSWMIQQYGKPSSELYLDHGFNLCVYEWRLADRIIQLETGKGFSMSISTDSDEPVMSNYYTVSFLIMKKSEFVGFMKACTFPHKEIPNHEKSQLNSDLIEMGPFTIYSSLPQYQGEDAADSYLIDRADKD